MNSPLPRLVYLLRWPLLIWPACLAGLIISLYFAVDYGDRYHHAVYDWRGVPHPAGVIAPGQAEIARYNTLCYAWAVAAIASFLAGTGVGVWGIILVFLDMARWRNSPKPRGFEIIRRPQSPPKSE